MGIQPPTSLLNAVLCLLAGAAQAAPLVGAGDRVVPEGRNCHAVRPAQVLVVATLNLAHGRGLAVDQFSLSRDQYEANVNAAAALVKREAPDVLALQEADGPSAWSGYFDHVARLARIASFPHVYHALHMDAALFGVHIRTGAALLATRPLLRPASHPFLVQRQMKGFVTAECEFDRRRVLLASIHLTSTSRSVRHQQVEQIVNTLQAERKPAILMGDFNSTWHDEEDAVRRIAARLKLQAFDPDSRQLATFRADAPSSRIDWILVSPKLEFLDYQVWLDQVSDHLCVVATLRWRR